VCVLDPELEKHLAEFREVWQAPIPDMGKLRASAAKKTREQRQLRLQGAKGYMADIAKLARMGKVRMIKDAHRWYDGNAYEGYLTEAKRAESAPIIVLEDSPEGRALRVLHRIARIERPHLSAGAYVLKQALSPQPVDLASAPPESDLDFVRFDGSDEERRQTGAWNELLGRELAGKVRPALVLEYASGRGFFAPWPWPPRRDGTIATGPPPPSTILAPGESEDYIAEGLQP